MKSIFLVEIISLFLFSQGLKKYKSYLDNNLTCHTQGSIEQNQTVRSGPSVGNIEGRTGLRPNGSRISAYNFKYLMWFVDLMKSIFLVISYFNLKFKPLQLYQRIRDSQTKIQSLELVSVVPNRKFSLVFSKQIYRSV